MPLDALASWLPAEPEALLWAAGISAGSVVVMKAGAVYSAVMAWCDRRDQRLSAQYAPTAPPPVAVKVTKFEAKPSRRRKKKKPLPVAHPFRPADGPRVQKLEGDEFVPWRVHLDECASSYERKKLLTAHGFHVTMTQEVGLLKAPDRRQLNFAIRSRAVIVTFDADFLAFHAAGERHSGIVHSPQDARFDYEILRVLLCMSMEAVEV